MLLSGVFIASISGGAFAQEPREHETAGTIDAVTVYRGQALVTRIIDIPGPSGLHEVIVTDLPARIEPGSIYAESGDGVEVRSVRYRERPVMKDVREEVRALDQRIRDLEDRMTRNRHASARLEERKAYLDSLEKFTATTATGEISEGVLDPDRLKNMSAFLFEQRDALAERAIELQFEMRDLQEQVALLQQERSQLTGQSSRTAREAVLFVNLIDNEGGSVQLRYLVNNATWTPSYNVRSESGSDTLLLEYYASIQQMSGEDWRDVKMSLSTATPTLVASAPTLESFSIALAHLGQSQAQLQQFADFDKQTEELYGRRAQVEAERNRADGTFAGGGGEVRDRFKNAQFDLALNEVADELQVLELGATKEIVRRESAPPGGADQESLSITYDILSRTTMPSRADRQFLQIAASPMQADIYRQAIPVLTSSIFEEARVTNTGNLVLLEGPVSSYRDGRFVGRGDLPTIAIGEPFTVGFGIDSSLRATREIISRDETIQGGNKIVTITYRLHLSNFADADAPVRVIDRMPTTQDEGIRVELVSTSHDLHEDSDWKKDGILRFDVDVPAGANGKEQFGVEYTIRLEHDKQMVIQGM